MGIWNKTVNMRVMIIVCLLACLALQTIAEPEPQPFFGLAGRLLAAVARGEKEDKEKKNNGGDSVDDGYSAPSSGYGAPSCACRRTFNGDKKGDKDKKNNGGGNICDCYGAPSSSYGAPSPTYGAPSYG